MRLPGQSGPLPSARGVRTIDRCNRRCRRGTGAARSGACLGHRSERIGIAVEPRLTYRMTAAAESLSGNGAGGCRGFLVCGCPYQAEMALAQARSLPKPALAPPPTRQTARKGRFNFLYLFHRDRRLRVAAFLTVGNGRRRVVPGSASRRLVI